MSKLDKWPVIGRLKRAVKKITFLLNLNVTRWRVASFLGGAANRRRRFSFNDRPGLRAAFPDSDDDDDDSAPHGRMLSRTASCRSSSGGDDDDDVDKRAEMFIANFYRQLRIERQVSLELHYCRGNSFGSNSSPT